LIYGATGAIGRVNLGLNILGISPRAVEFSKMANSPCGCQKATGRMGHSSK